jgi:hypothetical protein
VLKGGWYAAIDRATRSGFGLAFDPALFTCLWLFQSHGGWRGLRLAIIEPCTGWPYDLGEATTSGRCSRLDPGQVIETRTTAVIFTGRDEVSGIGLDGQCS